MDRRDFLKVSALAGAAAGMGLPALGGVKSGKLYSGDIVAVRNGEPGEMFLKGISELGGMGKFVKPGQTVVVKPNIAWARTVEIGANTNPELVACIVSECLKAGALKVYVFDHTCNNWQYCYRDSGIAEAATKAGAVMMPGNDRKSYRGVEIKGAKRLKEAEVHQLVLDCDVFINVPVLKHHGGATMTAAMKNLMGVVWDRGYWHDNDLPQCIADCTLLRKPDLNVVDAYRVMYQHGPRGPQTLNDAVKIRKQQLLSADIVGIDAVASLLLEMTPERIKYLTVAAADGLGEIDIKKLPIKKVEL